MKGWKNQPVALESFDPKKWWETWALKMGAYHDNGKSHHAWRWKMHFLLKMGIFHCHIRFPGVYHIKHAKFFRHQLWIRHSARVAEKISTPSHNLLRYSLSVQWLAHGIFMAHKIIRSHRGVSSCKTMSVKVKVSRASGPSQVMLRPSKLYTITTTTTEEKLQEIHPVLWTDSKTLAFDGFWVSTKKCYHHIWFDV